MYVANAKMSINKHSSASNLIQATGIIHFLGNNSDNPTNIDTNPLRMVIVLFRGPERNMNTPMSTKIHANR